MNRSPKVITSKDIKCYLEMPQDERRQRHLIAIAKAQFNSVECTWRHRMVMGAISPKKYREVVNEAERQRDTKIAKHTQLLKEIQNGKLE